MRTFLILSTLLFASGVVRANPVKVSQEQIGAIYSYFASKAIPIPQAQDAVESDVKNFVPFSSLKAIKQVLAVYEEQLSQYEESLNGMESAASNSEQISSYAQQMQAIYHDTTLSEAQRTFTQATLALKQSNATFYTLQQRYTQAKKDLSTKKKTFEKGANTNKGWNVTTAVIEFVTETGKELTEIITGDGSKVEKGILGAAAASARLATMVADIGEVEKKVKQFISKGQQVFNKVSNVERSYKDDGFLSTIEDTLRLQGKKERWEDLKQEGIEMLSGDIERVPGVLDYRRALLNVCNWGISLSASLFNRAQLFKNAIHKRIDLDAKKASYEQVNHAIESFTKDSKQQTSLMTAMSRQTTEVRADVTELLTSYCQAAYYNTLTPCKMAVSKDMDLSELRLNLVAAIRDSVPMIKVPSTVRRSVLVTDEVDGGCADDKNCPISAFKTSGHLKVVIPASHPSFSDLDNYKVNQVEVEVVGAKPASGQDNLLLNIHTEGGEFASRDHGETATFTGHGFYVLQERNLPTGELTTPGRVAEEYAGSVAEITPYATWMVEVVPFRSGKVDLSQVNAVIVTFHGHANDNEQ